MVRQTSIAAYKAIRENNLLSKRRFEVYDILFNHGPLTAHEVVSIAREHFPFANQTSFNARLSELLASECISVVGEKKNLISGMKNLLWDVTNKLPKQIKKPQKEKCEHCGGKGYIEFVGVK